MEKATERIINYYAEQTREESIEQQIQDIDRLCKQSARTKAIVVGVIGSLLMGVGMSCTMEFEGLFVPGVIVGIVGLLLVAVAYPLYTRNLASLRESSRGTVMQLARELEALPGNPSADLSPLA